MISATATRANTLDDTVILIPLIVHGLAFVLSAAAYSSFPAADRPDNWRKPASTFGPLLVILIALIFLLPSTLRRRLSGSEPVAPSILRTIATAQITYLSMHDGTYAATLSDLVKNGLLDERLAEEKAVSGYRFRITAGGTDRYIATAQPETYKVTACRGYMIDETGVLRVTEEDRPPTANDPEVN